MPFCRLKGSARYEEQDGRTALYLDGSSGTFAETPSLPIHRTNLTIAVWIKMKTSGANEYTVYGDWSYPWSFRLFIDPRRRFCAQARNTAGKDIIWFCTRQVSSHFLIIFKKGDSHSSHERESKTVLDSGFHVVNCGYQVLDPSLCQ